MMTKPLSSILEGDRRVCPMTFLYEIQCSTSFIWSIFGYNAYFWQRCALRWIYFLIFVHYNISKMAIFGAPSSTSGGDRHMRPLTFSYGIQCSTTFIWSVFSYNAYFWHNEYFWICFAIIVLLMLIFTFFACFKDGGHWLHFDDASYFFRFSMNISGSVFQLAPVLPTYF